MYSRTCKINSEISATAAQLKILPRNHIMSNLQKLELLRKYKRIEENGDKLRLLDLPDWPKEKLQLQKLSNKQTISRIIHNESKILEK